MNLTGSLELLQQDVKNCNTCKFGERKAILFGHGDPHARIMMVGEGPSIEAEASPDRRVFGRYSREPYEKFLEIVGETWDSVWTTNIVKCTLPHVKVGEFANCNEFFMRELALINPHYTVLFGARVVEWVLGTKKYSLTGQLVERHNRQFITLYHPMHVYRNPQFMTQWIVFAQKVKRIISVKRIDDYG